MLRGISLSGLTKCELVYEFEHSIGSIPYSCMSWLLGETKWKNIFLYETQMLDIIDRSTQFIRFL